MRTIFKLLKRLYQLIHILQSHQISFMIDVYSDTRLSCHSPSQLNSLWTLVEIPPQVAYTLVEPKVSRASYITLKSRSPNSLDLANGL